jgi:hypothetical protein
VFENKGEGWEEKLGMLLIFNGFAQKVKMIEALKHAAN